MAREDVNIRVSSNVAEAIRLWQAMEAGPQAMGKVIGAVKGKVAGQADGGRIAAMVKEKLA
jgi:uncharacterized protein YqeY